MSLSTHQMTLADEPALLYFAAKLALLVKQQKGAVIYLSGPLGAGKTTFTRGFMRGLGYKDKVKSPTYTIAEQYLINHMTVWHIDLYRLHHPDEWLQLGLAACFDPHVITLIEWPAQGGEHLPLPDIACAIDFLLPGRTLHFVAHTAKGERILQDK